jgi:alpha-L-rhamnosidase
MLYGYDTACAALTTTNVLSVHVFRRAAQMAGLLGQSAAAAVATGRADQLAAAINSRLVGPTGLYIDGLHAGGAPSTHASQQANALALAYGVVPAARLGAVGDHVAVLGMRSGPPHGLELCRALHAAGLDGALVALLTGARGPGYAHILAVGGTFTWESWTPFDLQGDSMSHGWGSSALVAMQEALLGVTFTGAGPTDDPSSVARGTSLLIRPPAGVLRRAAGTVATVAGPLAVAWRVAGSRLHVNVTVPANATATVQVPGHDPSLVSEAGRPVAGAPGITAVAAAGGTVTIGMGAGTYAFDGPAAAG